MNILVVPTIREKCLQEFMDAWQYEEFDEIIIVEDNPEKTFKLSWAHHYSWKEIDEELGDNSWIISRRDSAIRSFGFLKAAHMGAETIYSLDDDCFPTEPFITTHLNNLNNTPKWTESIPGMRTRGLPYYNQGKLKTMVNVGLWTNIPDLDSIQQISNPIEGFYPEIVNRIMPHGQYFPFCAMNFCFRSELTPLAYLPLMGEFQPYRRFDDIWFGIILKKICDHLNYHISLGHPFIEHRKASDPLINLVKEAPGIQMNETFWEIVDAIPLSASTPKECMMQIGKGLTTSDNHYIKNLGKAIKVWISYF